MAALLPNVKVVSMLMTSLLFQRRCDACFEVYHFKHKLLSIKFLVSELFCLVFSEYLNISTQEIGRGSSIAAFE